MGKKYPRIEMCDCGADFKHAYIYASDDVRSDTPIYSKEMGRGMIEGGEENGLLTSQDAKRLAKQLEKTDLPETQEDAWNALPEDMKEEFREAARQDGETLDEYMKN